MSKAIKPVVAFCSILLIVVAWGLFTTVESRLETERQTVLASANQYRERGYYNRAIPLFRQALSSGAGTDANVLYKIGQSQLAAGDYRQYRSTLDTLISGRHVPSGMTLADLYLEAFYFDYGVRSTLDIINLAREGWKSTGDTRLLNYYEDNRYAFITRRGIFEYAGVIFNGTAPIKNAGLWGFAGADGVQIIAPEFELATRLVNNTAIVQNDNYLRMVNRAGMRMANVDGYSFWADSVSHFNGNAFAIRRYGSNEYVIAYVEGLDINLTTDPFNPVGIDEFGRRVVNNRSFVSEAGRYRMTDAEGNIIGQAFDEARPFFEVGGLAAVRQGNLWGLVNANGDMVIDFQFEDARSSSSYFVAIQVDGKWGYITVEDYPEDIRHLFGRIVIEPQFIDAKQFVGGVAPVQTEEGWRYIALIRYQ